MRVVKGVPFFTLGMAIPKMIISIAAGSETQ